MFKTDLSVSETIVLLISVFLTIFGNIDVNQYSTPLKVYCTFITVGNALTKVTHEGSVCGNGVLLRLKEMRIIYVKRNSATGPHINSFTKLWKPWIPNFSYRAPELPVLTSSHFGDLQSWDHHEAHPVFLQFYKHELPSYLVTSILWDTHLRLVDANLSQKHTTQTIRIQIVLGDEVILPSLEQCGDSEDPVLGKSLFH